jgi:hypothetical protein
MESSMIVIGECDGTGAAINVCLGFIPRYVKVWNMEEAGDSVPAIIEWLKPMKLVAAIDEGFKQDANPAAIALVAANGISEYAGGDLIIYDGVTNNRWENSAGADVEEVYVDGHYIQSADTDPDYKCIGDSLAGTSSPRDGQEFHTPPGFTIGTDGDINVNGEQICWMAIR